MVQSLKWYLLLLFFYKSIVSYIYDAIYLSIHLSINSSIYLSVYLLVSFPLICLDLICLDLSSCFSVILLSFISERRQHLHIISVPSVHQLSDGWRRRLLWLRSRGLRSSSSILLPAVPSHQAFHMLFLSCSPSFYSPPPSSLVRFHHAVAGSKGGSAQPPPYSPTLQCDSSSIWILNCRVRNADTEESRGDWEVWSVSTKWLDRLSAVAAAVCREFANCRTVTSVPLTCPLTGASRRHLKLLWLILDV